MRFLIESAKRLPSRPHRPVGLSRAQLGALAVLGLVAVGLGACANPRTEDALVTGSIDLDGYRTRHPIVLAESAETLDIPVGGQSAVLTARMAHTVTVFAQDARRYGATGITILLPSGSANQAAANRLAQQVAGALAQAGFAHSAIARTSYQVEDGTLNAPVRVAYSRVKAMVMHRCGVWPDSITGGGPQNVDDWEIGCSSQTNVAAMVVHPEDLVTPTGEDPVDGTRRTNIITKYRAGSQTKAETGAKGASIADSVQGGN